MNMSANRKSQKLSPLKKMVADIPSVCSLLKVNDLLDNQSTDSTGGSTVSECKLG